MSNNLGLTVKGWRVFAHPLFCAQVEELIDEVQKLRSKSPENYKNKNATKRLAAISNLIWNDIPEDPTNFKYRQGETLGKAHTHWYRAKFFQQYRLFFRYHSEQKVIIYGWVNDTKTKRAYGSKTDAYSVFSKMLDSGNPPTSWDELLEECQSQVARWKNLSQEDLKTQK